MNASNQDDPEEIEDELRQVEKLIEVNRATLLERVKGFQVYQVKQIMEEKDEAK